jgi:hypothetical protein
MLIIDLEIGRSARAPAVPPVVAVLCGAKDGRLRCHQGTIPWPAPTSRLSCALGHVPWWPRPDMKLFNMMVHVLHDTTPRAGHAGAQREQLDGRTGVTAEYEEQIDTAPRDAQRAKIERAARAAAGGSDTAGRSDAYGDIATAPRINQDLVASGGYGPAMGDGGEHGGEQPLVGGRWTAGVVRAGDTVRRPASPASRFVARLLTHLAATGFDGCPQHLGWDQHGRDILSFVPGHVPARWQHFGDHQVSQAATLLRQHHDATRELASSLRAEVVCHHDPGPNNVVFRDARPVAFIDFDFAAPGRPLEDVGYMAWAWCISSRFDRAPVTDQARQVRILADAYGLSRADRGCLPAAIRDRRNEALWRDVLGGRVASLPYTRSAEVLAWTQRELAFIEANQDTFIAALRPV